jgi:hypothetical protein
MLDAQLDSLNDAVTRVAKEYPGVPLLMSQPGVGAVTALAFVLTLGDVHRFPRGKQVASYLGLIPRETGATTFQIDIAASQLTSLAGESINAIGFRLPGGAPSIASVTLSGFSLELSGSANPIGSLSATPSANIGANAQTVDSGTLVLSGLVGGSATNPFFLINFSTPYLYTGGDLLITDSYTSSSFLFSVDTTPVGSIMDTSAIINGTGPGPVLRRAGD